MPPNSADALVKLYVFDSHRMGTQLLRNTLSRDSRFEVLAADTASPERAACADVTLVSTSLHDGPLKGIDFVRKLRSIRPDAKAVVLIDSADRDLVMEVFRAGARGVFCRDQSSKLLARCMWSVHMGQIWAASTEIGFLLESLSGRIPMKLVDAKGSVLLSSREQDVVARVAEGMSNREIAEQLQLSEHTVKNYLFRIFEKLGVANRVELILYAVSQLSTTAEQTPADPFKDDTAVFSWYRQAAERCGVTPFAIAEMYRDGRGVPPSRAGALMWFLVAETICRDITNKSKIAQQSMRLKMSAEEVRRAKRQAIEWLKVKYGAIPEPELFETRIRGQEREGSHEKSESTVA